MNTNEIRYKITFGILGLFAVIFIHLVYILSPSATIAFMVNIAVVFAVVAWLLNRQSIKVALEQSFNIEDLFY